MLNLKLIDLFSFKSIKLYVLACVLLTSNVHFSDSGFSQKPGNSVPISVNLKTEFKTATELRIRDLEDKIQVISNKSLARSRRNSAVELAASYFRSSEQEFQVSNIRTSTTQSYTIWEYLNRLLILNFDRIDIEWVDIHWATRLRRAPDGKYYGVVRVIQTFKGYQGEQLSYEDVTTKTIEVEIDVLDHLIGDGDSIPAYQVLLGDVIVKETRAK